MSNIIFSFIKILSDNINGSVENFFKVYEPYNIYTFILINIGIGSDSGCFNNLNFLNLEKIAFSFKFILFFFFSSFSKSKFFILLFSFYDILFIISLYILFVFTDLFSKRYFSYSK